MKIPSPDINLESELDESSEIESEGMIELNGVWIPIETSVLYHRETEKAYFGKVIVYECDEWGRSDVLFEKDDTWIPKSMSDNPWWICTVLFSHPDKVSNRRFENDY